MAEEKQPVGPEGEAGLLGAHLRQNYNTIAGQTDAGVWCVSFVNSAAVHTNISVTRSCKVFQVHT